MRGNFCYACTQFKSVLRIKVFIHDEIMLFSSFLVKKKIDANVFYFDI